MAAKPTEGVTNHNKEMMRLKVAIVDAGTNSFLLLIAEKSDDHFKYLLDTSTVVGLGRLKSNLIDDKILKHAQEVINTYHKLCDKYEVEKRVIVGTEFFRKIDPMYFEHFSKDFDESMILSGSEEAKLSYLSVIEDENFSFLPNPVVMDIGGGSVEFAYKSEKFTTRSFPIGAMVLTSRFVKSYPIKNQLNEGINLLNETFEGITSGDLVTIGGTGTTIVDLIDEKDFDPVRVHGRFLKIEEVENLYDKLCSMSLYDLSKARGMEKGRERIIAAGALILMQAVKKINMSGCFVSIRGHRYTIAKDILEQKP